MTSSTQSARPRLLGRATFVLAVVSGLCLLLMLMLVCAAVVLRYFANNPILGVNEVVQLGAVAVVMLALPWCTDQNGHVRADVFDSMIGRWGRLFGDVLSRLLTAGVLSALVYRSWLKMLDAREFGDATNMLSLPIWPFYCLMVAGIAVCVLVLVMQATVVLISGKESQ